MSATAAKPLLGARVLVVDDDPDTREIFTFVLEDAGAMVRVASDASSGLSGALEWRPTIVVSDLAMPVFDGFSFVQRLRAATGLEHVPVVAVSGLVSAKAREDALAAGFGELVCKPVMPDELVDLVKRWAFQWGPDNSTSA